MSYPRLNLDIGNPLKHGAEVGIVLRTLPLRFWHKFFEFPHFVKFHCFDSFTLKNHVFTNVIDGIKCNNDVLKLPKVNTLCENSFGDVMIQFPKSEGWVSLTSLHSRFQLRFWWNSSLDHGFDPRGWEKLFDAICIISWLVTGWMLLYWSETLV